MNQIRPEHMAAIYHSRNRHGCVREIQNLMNYFSKDHATTTYWKTVLMHIMRKG